MVLAQVGVRSGSSDHSPAAGALDAAPAEDWTGASPNGSVGVNPQNTAERFVDGFGVLEAAYRPERGAVVPVSRAVNATGETVTAEFGYWAVYEIPGASPPGLDPTPEEPASPGFAAKAAVRIGGKTFKLWRDQTAIESPGNGASIHERRGAFASGAPRAYWFMECSHEPRPIARFALQG